MSSVTGTLIVVTKTDSQSGRILQRKIWQLPLPEPGRPSGWTYSLYGGIHRRTIVRYDNEIGKGDHRHVGPQERESRYVFTSLAKLLKDFAQDVERLSGEIK